MLTIGQLNKKHELEFLLNNCVDDDEAILLQREIKILDEEVNDNVQISKDRNPF